MIRPCTGTLIAVLGKVMPMLIYSNHFQVVPSANGFRTRLSVGAPLAGHSKIDCSEIAVDSEWHQVPSEEGWTLVRCRPAQEPEMTILSDDEDLPEWGSPIRIGDPTPTLPELALRPSTWWGSDPTHCGECGSELVRVNDPVPEAGGSLWQCPRCGICLRK